MTTRALASVLLAAALTTPLAAQDGGVVIEEGMLEVCPELKSAGPREQRQLVALFFDLGAEALKPEDAKAVRALFDLQKPEDIAILERYLDEPKRIACGMGLRAVFRAHGSPGQLWLLERYVKAPPVRRGRLIGMLAGFDDRDTWRVLLKLLDDKTPVPDTEAAQIAPPGYVDLRVCDYAMRSLSSKLSRLRRIRVKRTNRQVNSTLPIDVREHRIKTVVDLLKAHEEFKVHLTGLPRLRDGLDPDATKRAEAALESLGVNPR